ncbi:GNAT family N-acetyltransferase [Bordetella genomosp. 12]|uniref:GNAT family N-acetyltransferase n=1 Tax=Bordetella genomosp. 12 TaxID=463035 RepID=A0A261VD98_9BORD|nr:GNAT family N-acetyltransferase [Bordetella genomosp. 12]OZI71560.1 GNAT family N-acetyltransferase [Bordetella genomosp. 12]
MPINPCTARIRLAAADDVEALTALLHRAYAALGASGLRFMAVDQSADVTRQRMARGDCYVLEDGGALLATVVFSDPSQTGGSPWLDRPDVASLHQFGVEPALQRCGLGSRLLHWVQARARGCGAAEIALDTAEPAVQLRAWYAARGYREIEYAQWRHTNYRSVIMSKCLVSTA